MLPAIRITQIFRFILRIAGGLVGVLNKPRDCIEYRIIHIAGKIYKYKTLGLSLWMTELCSVLFSKIES